MISALRRALGPDGTLVMPTMTDGETVFDPRVTESVGMGITAETFWRQPGVVRSTHPGGSFAAAGPLAEAICAPQPLEPPHGPESPPGRVHALGGQVLLLGVEQSESTLLHVAEALAEVPYRVAHPTVVLSGGAATRVMIAETDHCCRGFLKTNAWLRERGLLREGTIGNAPSKIADAGDIVSVALNYLREDPLVFLCPRGRGCDECDAARDSIRVER